MMTVATNKSRTAFAAEKPQATPEMGKSIERMSGRFLGKIQRIGIEMCTEVADVTEKITIMDAVDTLSSRTQSIKDEQQELMGRSASEGMPLNSHY